MDIRYSSGKPASGLLVDMLERRLNDKQFEMFFSFEVNYRVGGRSRKTTFAGKQQVSSPLSAFDMEVLKTNS